jgi:hypothetical protein
VATKSPLVQHSTTKLLSPSTGKCTIDLDGMLSTLPPKSGVAVSDYYHNLRAKKDHRLTTTEAKHVGTLIA